jgi:hypothetical protein
MVEITLRVNEVILIYLTFINCTKNTFVINTPIKRAFNDSYVTRFKNNKKTFFSFPYAMTNSWKMRSLKDVDV